MKQIKLFIIIIFLLLVVGLFAEGEGDSAISDILGKLPDKNTLSSKLNALNQSKEDIEIISYKKKLYTRSLSLLEAIKDFTSYKQNVLAENSSILKNISIEKQNEKQNIYSYDDFMQIVTENKRSKRLFEEKKVIASQIEYEKEYIKQEKNTEKLSLVELKIDKSRQDNLLKSTSDEMRQNILDKINGLKTKIKITQQFLDLLDINLKFIDIKIPIARLDVETFKKSKMYLNKKLAIAKNNLVLSSDDLDLLKYEKNQKNKDYQNEIDNLNSKKIGVINLLSDYKEKRDKLYSQNIKNDFDKKILLYKINYEKTQIEYFNYKKYNIQQKMLMSNLNYQYFMLYLSQDQNQLSVKRLNDISTELNKNYKHIINLQKMGEMKKVGLKASIDTMYEMIRNLELDIANQSKNSTIAIQDGVIITHLKNEIVLKQDFVSFLSGYLRNIDTNKDIYNDIFDFLNSKIGLKKLIIREKKNLGQDDLINLVFLFLFILFYFVFSKKLSKYQNKKMKPLFSKSILVVVPILALLFFIISLFGFVNLYNYLMITMLSVASIFYLNVFLFGWLSGLTKKLENQKDEDKDKNTESEITKKISVFGVVLLAILRYTIVIISLLTALIIIALPINPLHYLISFLGIDPSLLISILISKSIKIAFILIISFSIIAITKFVGKKIYSFIEDDNILETNEKEARANTLINVSNNVIKIIVITFAFFSIMQELGMNITTLLTGAGIIGLAIGFGAQSLVKDFVSGFFILMENQFAVGDVIKINGVGGLVEKITMRVTVLRDLEGIVHIFPNGSISFVSNMTHGWSRAVIEVSVNYKENIDRVLDVLKEIGDELYADEQWKQDILDKPEVSGVTKLGDSGVFVRLLVKTKPIKQWSVGMELNRRIKNTFDAKGIEIPYPHMNVVFENKD